MTTAVPPTFARRLWLWFSIVAAVCLTMPAFSTSAVQPATTIVLLTALAVLAVSSARWSTALGALMTAFLVPFGARSRAHREPLTHEPAPSHPATADRPRPRAPGMCPAVT